MEVIALSFFTVVAWAAHVGLVSLYLPRFRSAKTVSFRVAHSIETAMVVSIMLQLVDPNMGRPTVLATVLGTLAIIDIIFFASFKSLRDRFDALHFIVAYSVVAAVILLLT